MLTVLKRAVVRRLGIDRIARNTDLQAAEVSALRAAATQLQSDVESLRNDVATLRCAAADASIDRAIDVWRRVELGSAVASTLRAGEITVSVVMATRDRSALLERALRSVLVQRHRDWQLIVVDDGSTDNTGAVLDRVDDDRVVRLRTEGIGAAAARNLGLDHATGDWVAFLDDDNIMDPGWLHAIAAFTTSTPDAHVAYGAQLRNHEAEHAGSFADAYVLFADRVDGAGLRVSNSIDLGALAVRRNAAELHFDATLTRFIDWDLVCRLEAVHTLHPLPVWTGVYTTDAPSRITSDGGSNAVEAFRRRLASPDDPAGRPSKPKPD